MTPEELAQWFGPLLERQVRDPFVGLLGAGADRFTELPQMATDDAEKLLHYVSTRGMGGPTWGGFSRLNPTSLRPYDINANASGTAMDLIWPWIYRAMMEDPGTAATFGSGVPS